MWWNNKNRTPAPASCPPMTSMPPTAAQTVEEKREKFAVAFKDAGVQVKERTTMARNKYLVRYSGKDITVYADKAAHVSDGISFWTKGDGVLNDLVAHFPHGAYFSLVEDVDPRPAPVAGVDYYTLEDLLRALKDLNYTSAENIVNKVRGRLSVRDDGRYTIGELKTAVKQVDNISGIYHAERFDQAALQARKNRVFDAYTR